MSRDDAFAQALSLAMTLPTVLLAFHVTWRYGRSTLRAIRSGVVFTPYQWLIAGIACHFLGSALDNLYWLLPWTAKFYGWPSEGALMASGVYFNIFFRQAAGIVAAYCHLRASELEHAGSVRSLNRLFAIYHIWGAFAFAVLMGTR